MSKAEQPSAIIAEDEVRLGDELTEMLAVLWPELKIVARAATGGEALAVIEEYAPDFAFLDIRMPGLSGLEVARQIGEQTRVVFVTAYDEHAVAAFDARAVDYVLKPVRQDRLADTVSRLKAALEQPPTLDIGTLQVLQASLAQRGAREYLRWINCGNAQGEIDVVAINEVLYFQSSDKYTKVMTRDRERLIRTPLKELIDQLDPDLFWQIHRSAIVQVAAIERVRRDDVGSLFVIVRDRATRLPVSRAFTHRFRTF